MRTLIKSLIGKKQVNIKVINRFTQCLSRIPNDNRNYSNDTNYGAKFIESNASKLIVGTTLTGLLLYKLYDNRCYLYEHRRKLDEIGAFKEDLPTYNLDELAQHTTKQNRIWVSYKEGVYDITEFVDNHPGGDQILMAAGSSVEPFWLLYGVHKSAQVLNILESFRIGNLTKEESKELVSNMSDPYSNEPKRHTALKPASEKPFNAEPPLSLLVENFLTPNELFYVRNHLPVPKIDETTYELEIEIEGIDKTLQFNLDDLKKMPKRTITATIMCAGNRRSEMTKVKPVKGLSWGAAAIGNATWTGVRLRDLLKIAGVDEDTHDYKHVQFEGFDLDTTGTSYGASIPFWRAIDKHGDVILAYEMNGVPIPRDHGYPIRVIVPGIVGARNVKWLGRIIVSKNESSSHWQQNDYKGFSPSTDWDTVDFTKSPAIQELPVISAICKPSSGEIIKPDDNGRILVKGYAWSGGGQKIVRVDVTVDGGKTWYPADIDFQDDSEPPHHWSWTLWSIHIPVDAKINEVEIWAKAVDSCYNTQPESFENIWNLRGVLSNAYHRVSVKLNQSN